MASGPERFGSYEIRSVLGEGGMGRVYLARQPVTHRTVALKVLRQGVFGDEARRRFERETRILGRLQHAGIASIYEAGSVDTDVGQQPYIAMEFVDGPDLVRHVREADLGPRERLALVADVCDAVHVAHREGIVHRDLKPANILVDAEGRPRVLDFGLARFLEPEESVETMTGQLLGTLNYMSPEQVLGDQKQVDPRSDVYALGVLTFELLADSMPYDLEGAPLHEVIRMIREAEPPALGSIDRRLRGDIETIVAKSLRKEKDRRYESADALAGDIRRHLRDEPIQARPTSTWYTVRKFARRHRILMGTALAVLLVLALSLVLVLKAERRAEDAEVDVRVERDEKLDLFSRATTRSRSRGEWEEVLTIVGEALREGHPEEPALRLLRVEALLALSRPDEAEQELDALEGLRPDGPTRARALLCRAELAVAGGARKARKAFTAALEAGLSGAEAEYARAMIAPTAQESVERLVATLELDPFHSRATRALALLLTLLARHDEAEAHLLAAERFFPRDVNLRYLRAFRSAVVGRRDEAKARLDGLAADLGEDVTALSMEAFELLHGLFHDLEGVEPLEEVVAFEKTLKPIVASALRLASQQARLRKDARIRSLRLALPTPLVLDEAERLLGKAFLAVAWRNDEAAVRLFRETHRILPLAVISYLEGLKLFGTGRFEEAYDAFLRAVEQPSLTGRLGHQPHVYATVCAWKVAGAKPEEAETWNRRAVAAARRVGKLRPYPGWVIAAVAQRVGAPLVARRIIEEAVRDGADVVDVWRIKAEIELAARAYPAALEAVDRFRKLDGRPAQADEIERRAREGLRKALEEDPEDGAGSEDEDR